MRTLVAALLLASSLSAAAKAAAQSISIPGGSQVQGWGIGGLQSVGQTFVATNASLTSFSFWLQNAAPPVTFLAYLFAWDDVNFRATGPALYVSGIQASPPPLPNFVPYVFNTNVSLVGGNRYVAFLSAVGGVLANVESTDSDVYAGGAYVYTNLPPNVFTWSTYTGVPPFPPPRDLRFEATFNVVPEPSSVALLATGLLGVGGVAWRRRKNAA